MSLLSCALGVWFWFYYPQHIGRICIMIGVLFIVNGAVKIMGYFSKDFYCLAFQYDLAFGILMSAVGIILISRRSILQDEFFEICGIMILADALFKIQTCLDARKFGLASKWWKILIMALGTGVLGILLLICPFAPAHDMLALTGFSFIAEGMLNLLVAIFTVKIL